MNVEFKWIKPLPIAKINEFEDRVVYNCALYTREYTKGTSAFPRLTGELERNEIKSPIMGSNKTYSLTGGVDYAGYVWRMSGVNWTNKATQPQWYYTTFKNHAEKIMSQAIVSSIKKEL